MKKICEAPVSTWRNRFKKEKLKIAVDSNFLLAIAKQKVDVMQEIKENFQNPIIAVTASVLRELNGLKKQNSMKKQAVIALKKIENAKAKILNEKNGVADNDLFELSQKNWVIATNDYELKKNIELKKGKIIFLRQKRFIESNFQEVA